MLPLLAFVRPPATKELATDSEFGSSDGLANESNRPLLPVHESTRRDISGDAHMPSDGDELREPLLFRLSVEAKCADSGDTGSALP